MEGFVLEQLHREEQIQEICILVGIIFVAFLMFAVLRQFGKR
nr:MAG TPA: FeoB-associated Cys-rich membrane protein [Caudoviricetes sp.]